MTRRTGARLLGPLLAILTACAPPGRGEPVAAPDGSSRDGIVSPAEDGRERPLRVLLTNDDGFDAPGVATLRRALTAAGHDVTLVAPAQRQSGGSGRVTLPSARTPLAIERRDPRGWAVGGSPVDAVLVALLHLLPDAPPDLVVSGANLGQNVGVDVNSSGTVGAAVRAASFAPAIAVSVEIELEEAGDAFPRTLAAFEPAASFVVRLVAALQASRSEDGRLLPAGTVLNVNHPARPATQVRGVRMARVGRTSSYPFTYRETDVPGELAVELADDGDPAESGSGTATDTADDADTTLLAQGFITLTLLDVARASPPAAQVAVARRLESLRGATAAADGR